ncbi:hypothetical protein M3Y94_00615200 [Aphelenchoides besseyi]|nr:hypothetical protein M3Y94_00608700 [Aphelenchoides besseyi]KAI6203944.1 hypothetical protein M3Y94_00615200 [Aphelenchoides besseyi]KAI6216924.1 hypothetical protein M3Y95_01247800 [Aphelenchoides besseyi]
MDPKTEDDHKAFKLSAGQRFAGWKVTRKLNEGGFGQVYIVERHGKQAALKAESNDIEGGSAIKLEISVLMLLNQKGHCPHVPHLYHAAKRKRYCYMIVTLLGDNLRDLKLACPDEKMRPETWTRIGIQSLYSIKLLHDCGFVHRDIKPANFVMGHDHDPERARLVHILDFGLARSYAFQRNGQWIARRARATAEFRGTVRYCAPGVHLRQEQGRKDDVWSLMYMLIEFHCGLPWQKEREKEKLEVKKLNISDTHLLLKFPEECHQIIAHLRALDCYNRPNYSMIHECLLKVMKRYNVSYAAPYDWEDPQAVQVINAARSKRADYEDSVEFFASDPMGINSAPPKDRTTTSDMGTNATVEDNKEIENRVRNLNKNKNASSRPKSLKQ